MNAPTDLLLPPHSIEAEQALLGGLMLDSNAWDRINDLVTEADFYRDDHRRIFRHIRRQAEAGKATDVVSVFDAIERDNEVDQTGGLGYLGDIANNTPSAANIRRHAEIVRERAALRRLIAVADEFSTACFRPGKQTAAALVEDMERRLAAELDENADEPVALDQVLTETLRYIDSRGDTSGLPLGFRDLDALTGGLEPGQLMVVAARPSVGKTLFACNVADSVAAAGKAVAFFTLEMSRREIGMRILSARASVSVHSMRAGTKAEDAWDRMNAAIPSTRGQRLWIDDKPAITSGYVRARVRRLQRKHGLDLVVIDYLGLMKGRGDNRVQEIGSVSRDLKAIAKELGVPIIVLAQLNRANEGRPDKRPMMSDLRDSGEIEQDADIVAMLHRESLYSSAPEWTAVAELLVRKNRNGPIGDLLLTWWPQEMRFSDHVGPNPRTRDPQPSRHGVGRGMPE